MIRTLEDLTDAVAITDAQIYALISRIDVKLNNIMFPCDDVAHDAMAGVDYEEEGDVGHRVETSKLVKGLLDWKKSLQDMLTNPALRGEFSMVFTQWDNPDI